MKTSTQFKSIPFVLFLFLALISATTNAQTPESCDCKIDTLGLRSYVNALPNYNENNPLKFDVPNATSKFAVLRGLIGSSSPNVVQSFIDSYPNVTTLVFLQIPGSENDDANLEASRKLKNRGYKNYIPAVTAYNKDAYVASGGTDMLLSSTLMRVIDQGAELGVHSWSDGAGLEAGQLPQNDPQHQPYIDYYIEMGFTAQEASDFYFYTINAATSQNIHLMTETEIEQYKLRTCKYSAAPSYTATANGATLNANISGASYQWVDCDNGNSPIPGATNQTFTASSNGNYAVQITEANCSGMSPCYPVTALSIVDNELSKKISVYPNPSQNNITIDTSQLEQTATVTLFSFNGKLINQWQSSYSKSLHIQHNYTAGLYLLRIQTKDAQQTIQIVVE